MELSPPSQVIDFSINMISHGCLTVHYIELVILLKKVPIDRQYFLKGS